MWKKKVIDPKDKYWYYAVLPMEGVVGETDYRDRGTPV